MANQLGDYLKARRANVKPEEVDLPRGGVRRVPGLRREEVASLAGLSVDYYTRLEQGREQNPSPSVLTALARVLRLGPDAQRYLFGIATPSPEIVAPVRRKIGQNLIELLDDWTDHPAALLDGCQNILVANHLGRALFAGHRHSDNLARLVFLDEDGPTFYRDWNRVASTMVASIRAAAMDTAANSDLMALVGELTVRSEEFSKRWAKADVLVKTTGMSCVNHPLVGELDLKYETFRPNGLPDVHLKVYRAVKGSEMAEKLAMLGSLTAATPTVEPARSEEVQ